MSLSVDTSSRGERTLSNLLLAKVFLYMFIGLLYTIGIAVGLYFILTGTGLTPQTAYNTYTTILIVSACVQLVLTFVIMFTTMKHPSSVLSILIPAILYATCMGVLITGFSIFLPFETIAGAFGVACLAFGGMALVGVFSKKSLNVLGVIGSGLLFSVIFGGLFFWIFYLWMPSIWNTMSIIVAVVIIIAVMLITAYDVHNIKKTIEHGEMSQSLALYCAFQLYLDFILIFLKILEILARTRH